MAAQNEKLTASVRQATKGTMFYAFIAKGANDGVLLVEKKKIPAKEITDAKNACGGKKAYEGQCGGEEGKLVFNVSSEAPAGLDKQIKTVIKRDAGLTLDVEIRVVVDEAAPGQAPLAPEAPPAPAGAGPPSPEGAAVIHRMNGLSAAIKATMAGPNAARVQAQFVAASALVKKKEYHEASQALDQLEALLRRPRPPHRPRRRPHPRQRRLPTAPPSSTASTGSPALSKRRWPDRAAPRSRLASSPSTASSKIEITRRRTRHLTSWKCSCGRQGRPATSARRPGKRCGPPWRAGETPSTP